MKKLYAVFLSLVMMFAFASTAMAAELAPGLYLQYDDGAPVKQDVTITDGQSVYDVLKAWAGDRAEWKEVASDIGDGTGQVLVSLDGKGSVPYNNGDEYEIYDPEDSEDPVLAKANEVLLKAFPTSGGLYLWLGDGVGMNRTGQYGIYVGQDWMFTVNGERPVDTADPSVELYMNQAIINAGDVIVLTYGMVYEPYAM